MSKKKNEKVILPKMPPKGQRPFKILPIKAELMLDHQRYSSGSIGMVVDSLDFEDIEIKVSFGCGITVIDKSTGREYGFGPQEIVKAFKQYQGEMLP